MWSQGGWKQLTFASAGDWAISRGTVADPWPAPPERRVEVPACTRLQHRQQYPPQAAGTSGYILPLWLPDSPCTDCASNCCKQRFQLDGLVTAEDPNAICVHSTGRMSCRSKGVAGGRSGAVHAGLQDLQSIPVEHCREAYGLVLSLQSGCKLAYSGDTRPCLRFARAARAADLLIHEATFAPDLQAMVRDVASSSRAVCPRAGTAGGMHRP